MRPNKPLIIWAYGTKTKPRREGHAGAKNLNDPGECIQAPAQGGEAGDSACHLLILTRVNAKSSALDQSYSFD